MSARAWQVQRASVGGIYPCAPSVAQAGLWACRVRWVRHQPQNEPPIFLARPVRLRQAETAQAELRCYA